MRLRYKVRYFQEDDWWLAEVPDIAGGQMTQGETLEEARHMASDLVTTMLLVRIDAGEELDPPTEGRLPSGWEWVYPDARIEVAMMVRSERQKAGLTMQQAAARMGVKFATYQRWEDPEKCNATISTLERVARAFGRVLEVRFKRTA
jgi:antitoxin HicB